MSQQIRYVDHISINVCGSGEKAWYISKYSILSGKPQWRYFYATGDVIDGRWNKQFINISYNTIWNVYQNAVLVYSMGIHLRPPWQ